jgi:type VI secretion system protein VasI
MKLSVVFFLGGALPALAAGECQSVSNDLDRLACYDRESGRTPSVEPVSVDAGAWQVQEAVSKMTDQKDIYLRVQSEEAVNCGWNGGQKIDLYLRCSESVTGLFFATGCHMASGVDGYGDIEYRIDKETARKVSGDASTDNKALGLWSGGSSIPVIKQMLGKSEMVVRMTPYSESPFTATFKIAGLDNAIESLRKECRW